MIIIVKDVKVVTGQSGDEFHVGETSATTLIAQGEEDRIAIEQFISQHVPTIDVAVIEKVEREKQHLDEDVMEAVWPACHSQED